MIRALRTVIVLVAASLTLLLLTTSARAEDRIAVHIEGPKAKQIRGYIVDMLPAELEEVSEKDLRIALARSGMPGPMGFAITSRTARPMLIRVIKKARTKAEVAAVVVGRTKMGAKGLELVAFVVDEGDDLAFDDTISLAGGEEEQRANLAEALLPIIGAYAPAPEPAPEPEPEPEPETTDDESDGDEDAEEEEDEESDWRANRPGGELFHVGADFGFGGRFFSYADPIGDFAPGGLPTGLSNLRPFSIFGAGRFHVHGSVYPAATLGIPVASDIGIVASYMQTFGLSSETDEGRFVFGSNYNRLWVGLRYRYRIDDESDFPFVVGLSGKFGLLNYTFDPENAESEAIADEVPDVEYLLIKIALDGRLPLADFFALVPSFGYVAPISGGGVYDRFSSASTHGIAAGLGLAFPITMGFEARLDAEYTRFFTTFDPQVGDAFVAGGALDQYVDLRVGALYRY